MIATSFGVLRNKPDKERTMTVKDHYNRHLGNFYSWMVGDFNEKQKEHQAFLESRNIVPHSTAIALDLGAGHGVQSVSLARLGFSVKAIDFNLQLLTELKQNTRELAVTVFEDDIRRVKKHADPKPELVMCWGDTLTHLDTIAEVRQFIVDCCDVLAEEGTLIFSFRDYTTELTGDNRFIPVKSDDTRILTCCLDYETERVRVTDLLHVKTDTGWKQNVGSYYKLRLSPRDIVHTIAQCSMTITYNDVVNRMVTIIATKHTKG